MAPPSIFQSKPLPPSDPTGETPSIPPGAQTTPYKPTRDDSHLKLNPVDEYGADRSEKARADKKKRERLALIVAGSVILIGIGLAMSKR